MKQLLFILGLIALPLATANAGSVNMSCAQAKAYYNKHGRIYVRTGHGTVVPIYGLRRSCPGWSHASPYWVQATDNSRCVLGYRCYDRGHGR